jgi:NarL family two-component system response regulator LiaR
MTIPLYVRDCAARWSEIQHSACWERQKQAQRLRPDVVLMDLNLPELDGISATATLHGALPQTEVVVLTGVLNPTSVLLAMQAGASGYLFKDTGASEIRTAIKDVVEGRVILSPQATALLVNQIQPKSHLEPLTEREREVLDLLAQGASNKEIRQALHITEATVKAHVRHILSKLGAQSRTQAILVAIRFGLVKVPSSESQ